MGAVNYCTGDEVVSKNFDRRRYTNERTSPELNFIEREVLANFHLTHDHDHVCAFFVEPLSPRPKPIIVVFETLRTYPTVLSLIEKIEGLVTDCDVKLVSVKRECF